ncbi:MAG: FixH family protein [Betaproteobacteria bacterium]|nr:MAG: FixH family protein [Betaproteobacteria bacterium]
MSHRASSFPARHPLARWYREPWPWLLMAGPFVVVVASLASAWIAIASDDGLVAEDYYKQGLLINRRLAAMERIQTRDPSATITFGGNGEVRVHLEEGTAPSRLSLRLRRPGDHSETTVSLSRADNGDWVGKSSIEGEGRWIVEIESDRWQLPVTTIAGRPSQIHVGLKPGVG